MCVVFVVFVGFLGTWCCSFCLFLFVCIVSDVHRELCSGVFVVAMVFVAAFVSSVCVVYMCSFVLC